MANNCPDTRIVLGGYSLGAAVTDVVLAVPFAFFGFDKPLPPGADQHIAAVALFGNGSAVGRARSPTSARSTASEPSSCATARTRSATPPTRKLGGQLVRPRRQGLHRCGHGQSGRRLRRGAAQRLVDAAQVTGDRDARRELVVGRVVHADQRQSLRAVPPRSRWSDVVASNKLAHHAVRGGPRPRPAAHRPASAPSTSRTRRR